MACRTQIKRKVTIKTGNIDQKNLKEAGRLQYFFHSPSSELPIRDVLNEQNQAHKKEPHIEIGAENYWVACYQPNNIVPFIRSNEKYLFLMTTCRNKKLKPFYGKKFIVGYIVKKSSGENTKNVYFVKGDTRLYSFKDALPISKLGYSKFTRMKLVDEGDTQKILRHFNKRKNVLKKCIKEIKRLDKDNITCLRIKEGYKCPFKDECLRWKV